MCVYLQAQGVVIPLVDIATLPAAEMASSIKLQVLRVLSAMLDYPVVMEIFLNFDHKKVSIYIPVHVDYFMSCDCHVTLGLKGYIHVSKNARVSFVQPGEFYLMPIPHPY